MKESSESKTAEKQNLRYGNWLKNPGELDEPPYHLADAVKEIAESEGKEQDEEEDDAMPEFPAKSK
jgi:hypothetical protein